MPSSAPSFGEYGSCAAQPASRVTSARVEENRKRDMALPSAYRRPRGLSTRSFAPARRHLRGAGAPDGRSARVGGHCTARRSAFTSSAIGCASATNESASAPSCFRAACPSAGCTSCVSAVPPCCRRFFVFFESEPPHDVTASSIFPAPLSTLFASPGTVRGPPRTRGDHATARGDVGGAPRYGMTDVGSRSERGPRYAYPPFADTDQNRRTARRRHGNPSRRSGDWRHMLERLQPSRTKALPSIAIVPA